MIIKCIAAILYDCFILVSLFFAFTACCLFATHNQTIMPHTRWYQLSLGGIYCLYYLISVLHGGQTLGMRAWRLKIVSPNNHFKLLACVARLTLFLPACLFSMITLSSLQKNLFRWTKTQLIRLS